jgi:hypothetical protein
LLGPATARVEYWHDRFISKNPCRSQQHLAQPSDYRGDLGRRIPHPKRQRGAIDQDALALHHLRLAIQR